MHARDLLQQGDSVTQHVDYDGWDAAPNDGPPVEVIADWPPPLIERREILPWMSWLYTLILPLALWLILLSAFITIRSTVSLMTFTVVDSATDQPIPGARVSIDSVFYQADEAGTVTTGRLDQGATIVVEADGYNPVRGNFSEGARTDQRVALLERTLIGKITDQDSGEPIPGADVWITSPDGALTANATTDESGTYRLVRIPEDATVHVSAPGYQPATIELGRRDAMDVPLVSLAGSTMIDKGVAMDPIQRRVNISHRAVSPDPVNATESSR